MPDCEALSEGYNFTCHIIKATLDGSEDVTVLAGGPCGAPFDNFKQIEVFGSTEEGSAHQVLILDDSTLWMVETSGSDAEPAPLFACAQGAFSFALFGVEVLIACGDGLHVYNLDSNRVYQLSAPGLSAATAPGWLSSFAFPSLSTTNLANEFIFNLPIPAAGTTSPQLKLGKLALSALASGRWTRATISEIEVPIPERDADGSGACARSESTLGREGTAAATGFATRVIGVVPGSDASSTGTAMVQLGEQCNLDDLSVRSGAEDSFRAGTLSLIHLDDQTKHPWPYLGMDGNPFVWQDGLVGKLTAGKRMMVAVCGGGPRGGGGRDNVGCPKMGSHVTYWNICRLRPTQVTETSPPPDDGSSGFSSLSSAAQISIIVICSAVYLCCCWGVGMYVYTKTRPKPTKPKWKPNALQALILKLFAFYKIYNPSQLDQCLSVSKFHLDKQDLLNAKLRAKYGADLNTLAARQQTALSHRQQPTMQTPRQQTPAAARGDVEVGRGGPRSSDPRVVSPRAPFASGGSVDDGGDVEMSMDVEMRMSAPNRADFSQLRPHARPPGYHHPLRAVLPHLTPSAQHTPAPQQPLPGSAPPAFFAAQTPRMGSERSVAVTKRPEGSFVAPRPPAAVYMQPVRPEPSIYAPSIAPSFTPSGGWRVLEVAPSQPSLSPRVMGGTPQPFFAIPGSRSGSIVGSAQPFYGIPGSGSGSIAPRAPLFPYSGSVPPMQGPTMGGSMPPFHANQSPAFPTIGSVPPFASPGGVPSFSDPHFQR